MEPTSPILPGLSHAEIVYAKDQPEYKPLPVLRSKSGVLLSRWTLTESEREAIALGADIFLYNWTFNQPLQPVKIEVGVCDRDFREMADFLGLRPIQSVDDL